MSKIVSWLLIVCLLPYLAGCGDLRDESLTGKLWSGESVGGRFEPAHPPNLKLYQAEDRKDVLVQYDEQNSQAGVPKPRAYFLHANQKRIDAGRKPRFVKPADVKNLSPILVDTNGVPATGLTNEMVVRAYLEPNGQEFTLVYDGRQIGVYRLPMYPNGEANFGRIFLTPATVAGDVAIAALIAAAVVGAIYLTAWAESHQH